MFVVQFYSSPIDAFDREKPLIIIMLKLRPVTKMMT